MKTLLLVAAALTLTACVHPSNERAMSVRELVAQKDRLVGQTVTVQGHTRLTPNARGLWHSREVREAKDVDYAACISLTGKLDLVDALTNRNGTNVRVKGVLWHEPLKENEINLGLCSDYGITVQSVTPAGR